MTNEQKVIIKYLEELVDKPLSISWNEYHWREASEVLLNANVAFGLETWEEINGLSIPKRKCNDCKKTKEITEFYQDKIKNNGVRTDCKECTTKKNTKWRLDNLDKVKKQKAKYFQEIKEKIYAHKKDYTSKRIKHDTQFRLSINLRSRLYKALNGNFKSGSAVTDLGCSIEELKIHLKSQFTKGMSWKNYGLTGWHMDHILPLSGFDLTKREELLVVCHYTNIQPLWAKDNASKGGI